jgi:hypothetical protein
MSASKRKREGVDKSPQGVMQYFDTVKVDGNEKGQCVLCKAVGLTINLAKHGSTTSNFRAHLKAKHPSEFAHVSSQEESLDSEVDMPPKKIHQMVDRRIVTRVEKEKIDDAISYMVAVDYEPISVVDHDGFSRVCKALNPAYNLPHRHSVAKNITDKYVVVRDYVKTFIRDAKYYSFTSDVWQSDDNQHHLTLTLHYIVGNHLHDTTLGTAAINMESAPQIALQIESILKQWEIPLTKIVAAVTDNAPNMIKAIEILQLDRVPCTAHTLNLAMEDLFKDPELDKLFHKCIKAASEFQYSGPALHKLMEIQKTEFQVIFDNLINRNLIIK